MPDLLIELFSEEIPARMQVRAAEDLKKLLTDGLVEAGLTYAGAASLSTPRRLTLAVEGLLAQSPDTREERKGPKVGAPDKAIEGFLRGAGVAREQLEERDTPKGPVYFATIEKQGRPAADIIAEVLEAAIRNFPWPKSMRWGTGSLRWVRPLHSILCILSDEAGASVVPLNIDGIKSGDTTQGHRFMSKGAISVTGFDDYEAKLKAAKVILSPSERADHIWAEAQNAAFAQGLEIVDDKGLLAEVAGLVEWPVVLMGDIADDFINLPPEVLQTSMREHQKFFSVKNPKTDRIEKFITVANIETADNGATILAGNQKVLFARLADAKFFWENDIRVAEAGGQPWLDSLSNVTFHNKLGTESDRIERIAAMASALAPAVSADADLTQKAARWAKADLSSEMVYEFPELQGLMGKYYAGPAGHPVEVANAASEHRSPLGPSDDVPSAPVSVAVALADKLDTLTGFWAIDEKPTGSKDPFALRRAALGVIRLVLDNGLRIELDKLFDAQLLRHEIALNENGDVRTALLRDLDNEIADHGVFGAAIRTILDHFDGDLSKHLEAVKESLPDTSSDLLGFFHDRLKVYLKDKGIRHDVIDACLAMPGNDDLTLLVKRAEALATFLSTDDGENLIQGVKRASNILTQAEEKDGVEYSYGADVKFAEDDSEKALFAALDAAEAAITPAMKAEDFATAMTAMAALRAPIDAFFEAVQINADNQVIRRNRLNLLSRIRTITSGVAHLSKIEG
ncbi:glycyl-tRNA synthetase beta chain [Aliiroseovarius halocynthiae]|uniref:Glycine--tRNA ligase beta subunit n=1 Tax=Aliiroseovarius halocynthiae TaxID=985055 RepID=A0A545SRB6_9RHOB|nr:glycine--tRNA ligase subunit beta [Aliiroseovarius halocynthiae]TQV67513.1 glycine--tRNA ligase subunit beta [Aliiroseovarius halocynthiae]SMR81524.1 glycyl-tRNA synthetase beta chain [Aliiroseovarius halocynthiae]